MARALGALYVLGATIGSATLLLPAPEGTNEVGLGVIFLAAYAAGGVLLAARDRVGPWQLVPMLAFATVLITLASIFGEGRISLWAMFYVWVALVAGYFLTWTQVAVQGALVVAGYSAALLIARPEGGGARFIVAMGTVLVSGVMVASLRRGVAQLASNVQSTARTDALTGLANRRGFDELFAVEVERSLTSESPLALLLLDLDDFKSVNERLGHAGGDRVLRAFATALNDSIRRIDHAARIDGEGFAVLLPDTEPHSAYLLAERLRRRLSEEVPAYPVKLQVSIGVASSPKHGLTASELMHAGDRALHAAKSLGRDRAVMYDAEIVGSLIAAEERGELRREENLAAVMVLAETLDIRDTGTARHSQTVGHLAALTARRLGMPDDLVERVRLAGVLHDIGKIGVPDAILRKPGPLTDDEYEEMKNHASLGARIVAGANLEDISAWVLAHHERPDGRGYPHGLRDHDIPLEAKILAVADSYEAMTSDRVYRMSIGHAAAQDELRRCAGEQFDPVVVDALVAALAEEPADAHERSSAANAA
jgi:diguanylate cyclase (GGDEF)-like protein/putative nucleotidyltransferase with HDIG domain